jgi:hypothetical protein
LRRVSSVGRCAHAVQASKRVSQGVRLLPALASGGGLRSADRGSAHLHWHSAGGSGRRRVIWAWDPWEERGAKWDGDGKEGADEGIASSKGSDDGVGAGWDGSC